MYGIFSLSYTPFILPLSCDRYFLYYLVFVTVLCSLFFLVWFKRFILLIFTPGMVFPPRVGAQIICSIVHWISNLQDPLYLLFGLLIYPDLYSILLLSLFFFLCFGLWASGALLIYNIVFWCPDPGHFLYIWERLSLKIGICYILKIFLDRLGKFSGTLYWNFFKYYWWMNIFNYSFISEMFPC